MRARIRDFLENNNGWIFAVADYNHMDGIRCVLRYVPDPQGERRAKGRRYRKIDFDDAYAFLKKERPDYVKDMHVVPEEDVIRIYRPHEELKKIIKKDGRVREIAFILAEGGVPWDEMGITGSMLMGLQSPISDIDFVVYGPWWWKARKIVAEAKKQGLIKDLDESMWHQIYFKRRPEISFREFVLHEKRKGNRGLIDGTYFDLLFARDWSQIEFYPTGKPLGRKRITARVTGAEFAFDSPAIFKLDDDDVKEIYCYTHTYAGQALPGEEIEAMGVIEKIENGTRLVVGTTREARGEWIRSLTLLKAENEKGSLGIE